MHVIHKSGQSLVEVIVAVFLITMVLVGLIAAINYSLANIQYSRNRTAASQHVQKTIEWLRQERDNNGWTVLYSLGSNAGRTYCLTDLPAGLNLTQGSCGANDYITGTIFRRQIIVATNGNNAGQGNYDDRVTVTVDVSWQKGNASTWETVTAHTYLTKWK